MFRGVLSVARPPVATVIWRGCVSSLSATRWLSTRLASLQQSVQVTVSEDRKNLKLLCEGEPERRFHGIWLRHHCRCSQCHNWQSIIDGRNIKVKSANIEGDQVKVDWSVLGNTVHTGYFPLDWLKENDYSNPEPDWNNKPLVADSLPVSNYDDVMTSDEGLYQWLLQLNQYGVSLVKNIPTRKLEVIKLVERIGPYAVLPYTIYGRIFEVAILDDPTNEAYTGKELFFHQDQGYYESTPGLQFLHCLKFDACVEGGATVLLDAYPIVEEIRRKHPKQFDTLTKVPVRFVRKQKYSDTRSVDFSYEKKTIDLNRDGEIVGINWYPQFLSPLHPKDDCELEEFYDAFTLLAKMFKESQLQLSHRLQPGEALTFNNRRVVHARTGYKQNGGQRLLEGVYVSMDDFRSRFFTLREELGKTDSPKMIFNSSSSQ